MKTIILFLLVILFATIATSVILKFLNKFYLLDKRIEVLAYELCCHNPHRGKFWNLKYKAVVYFSVLTSKNKNFKF